MYYNTNRPFLSSIYIENDTITELGCFSILWGRIEYCFFENFFKVDNLDDISTELCNNTNLTECHDKIIKILYDWSTNKNIVEIVSRLRPQKNVHGTKLSSILGNSNANNEDKMWAVLFICSRIRNNMFHGEKDEYQLNRQKELFAIINDFLCELLKITQCYHIKK
ncbi:MAG TPA: hypothetical protein DD733_08795 [Clostridiales bacterium]|jgi:hypothetical protein|nr:hypothetical protein [Clostridiales bacterium]